MARYRDQLPSRSPRGERGLKLPFCRPPKTKPESLPARGAWIETHGMGGCERRAAGRSPRGERGLKPSRSNRATCSARRSPRGERGLKQQHRVCDGVFVKSLPARGAWIETVSAGTGRRSRARRSPRGERGLKHERPGSLSGSFVSLPARGAWIETTSHAGAWTASSRSLPARGAWIETWIRC